MQVKTKYKQTEIGLIPEAWEIVSLGEKTSKVGSGITPTGGVRVYKQFGRPFVRSQNIGWGKLLLDDVAFITDEIHQTFSATEIMSSDVLLNITGASIGRSAIAESEIVGGNVNQHVCIIRPIPAALDSRFLNVFLLSQGGQKQIDSFQAGGNRQGLNFMQIRSFRMPAPPLPEQRAIATALSDVDALINSLDRLISKKRDVKQATMQQLLTGRTRLPGFKGKWLEKSLLEMVEHKKERFDDGDWIEASYLTRDGVRLVQTGNVGVGIFVDKASKKYISDESFRSLRCKVIHIGDILVCRLAEPAGRACVLPQIDEFKVITSVDVSIFRPLPIHADSRFLVQWFTTNYWLDAVEQKCGGSTRSRIARSELGKMTVKLPPVQEQAAIADVLCDMDSNILVLKQRRDKTLLLKQGMMQELLTGRTRLV